LVDIYIEQPLDRSVVDFTIVAQVVDYFLIYIIACARVIGNGVSKLGDYLSAKAV
jgi:hypothetical protein